MGSFITCCFFNLSIYFCIPESFITKLMVSMDMCIYDSSVFALPEVNT